MIDISSDRLAVFNYAHVPWLKKHQVRIEPDDLPAADVRIELLRITIETLAAAGHQKIWMEHLAKATDELAVAPNEKTLYRNCQGYSTRAGCDVY